MAESFNELALKIVEHKCREALELYTDVRELMPAEKNAILDIFNLVGGIALTPDNDEKRIILWRAIKNVTERNMRRFTKVSALKKSVPNLKK